MGLVDELHWTIYGAETFLTNDSDLKKVKDISVLVLKDFLEK